MMKLLRAEFSNFRLLRDLELQFSTDSNKKLTVIRAANESGKTTILHALQWALYGDAALPDKGLGFRLHPIDWDDSDGRSVLITATIEFELTTSTYRKSSGGLRETRQRYLLVRSVYEDVDSQVPRRLPTVDLFTLDDTGTSLIGAPESWINEKLPPDLREVFFTDGDRALSFIEADVARSTKRERVQRAIRSLLGLGVIEDAIKHVRKSATEVNKKAKQIDKGGELDRVASRLVEVENDLEKLEIDLEDAKQQFLAFDEKVNDIEHSIAIALQMGAGNNEKLQKDLDRTKHEIARLDEQLAVASEEHSALFRSRAIAVDLLEPLLGSAFKELEDLHDQGKIPHSTIPVLQDRLSAEVCICGETLEIRNASSEKRRKHIEKLIEKAQTADEIQETITSLYFGAKALQISGGTHSNAWLADYKKVVKHRDGIQTLRDEAGRKLRDLENQLDSLPDTDIKSLRDCVREYKHQRDRCLSKRAAIETQLLALRREQEDLEIKSKRLLSEKEKGALILAEREVTQDVTKVLQHAYEQITDDELNEVSKRMNSIFLEMIGSDPEQGAIIQRAEISRDFDMIVYGPNNKTLDPDKDLNGASRRALTLAFILALARVSEVEAPNVIDTPLGMTSGYVKRSILRTAVRESAQLILFLTHDEIAGCEDVIDEEAGMVCTLTNPTHYPKMLVNEPDVAERKVLLCECNHRTNCELCHRRVDAQGDLEIT